MNAVLRLIFNTVIDKYGFKKQKGLFYEYFKNKFICVIFFLKMNYFYIKLGSMTLVFFLKRIILLIQISI